jgi:excisionase family DNA binding protein
LFDTFLRYTGRDSRQIDRPVAVMKGTAMTERLLTITQTADQFNLSPRLLYDAVARGELPIVRFQQRGRIRLRERDVHDWIESHRSRPDSTPPSIQPVVATQRAEANIEHLLPPRALRRFAR